MVEKIFERMFEKKNWKKRENEPVAQMANFWTKMGRFCKKTIIDM